MKKHTRRRPWLFVLILILMGSYALWALIRPLPDLKPVVASKTLRFNTPAAVLSWPNIGQSAVGVSNTNILYTKGLQKAVPTASTAKIITALVVLKAKPLDLNQPGPTISLSAADINLYQIYAAQDGSVVPVQAGEQINEYQMLEAMLLPSANNIADSLATWAYGSLPAYKAAANGYLKQLGLKDTVVGDDASGFSPTTVSTARDLVRLGEIAMQNPVLAQIVGQSNVSNLPVVNNVKNVNFLLGTDGIVGIKTGNNNQDPGVFLSASRTVINKKPITIVTALMQAPTLYQALELSRPLIRTAATNFKPITILRAGSTIGQYSTANDDHVAVVTDKDLNLTTWNGSQFSGKYSLPPLAANSKQGKIITDLTVMDPITGTTKSVALKLANNPIKPTIWQRLLRP